MYAALVGLFNNKFIIEGKNRDSRNNLRNKGNDRTVCASIAIMGSTLDRHKSKMKFLDNQPPIYAKTASPNGNRSTFRIATDNHVCQRSDGSMVLMVSRKRK